MTAAVELAALSPRDEAVSVEKVADARRAGGKNRDAAVDDIVLRLMHQQEHCHKRHGLEQHRARGDEAVFLHALVEPFDTDQVKKD